MDVWFDSGTSWAGVVAARPRLQYPADLYLEGSDQHRGWFQSSLLPSVAARRLTGGGAPYKSVLTHGFVLDEKGFKMSKSLGNVIDPAEVIDGDPKQPKARPAFGADVLRLWVSSCDYSSDVSIGPNIIKQTAEQFRKVRNTVRYLLGNLNGVDAEDARFDARDEAAYAALPSLDKWLLGRLARVEADVAAAYDAFQFSRAYGALLEFISRDLSAFYLDVAKDRLYISAKGDARRVACQATIKAVHGAAARAARAHRAAHRRGRGGCCRTTASSPPSRCSRRARAATPRPRSRRTATTTGPRCSRCATT